MQYYHALEVEADKCHGHSACMRKCPTQAIRVRRGKAVISNELCVDCGSCITACPEGAIVPLGDPVDLVSNYKFRVLVPSSVFYSQFDPGLHPHIIREACRRAGFDAVVDIGRASLVLARAVKAFVKAYHGPRPLISSHCPAVLRLIQVRFPGLVDQIMPVDVPREMAAMEIRKTFPERLGIRPEELGVVYASPCPAKMISIKQPAEKDRSWFDAAISIADLYAVVKRHIHPVEESFDLSQVPKDFSFFTDWSAVGGVSIASGLENWLAVYGLEYVIRIFDDIENSRLRNIDFVEAMGCVVGCVGGPFNVENPYVARTNSIKQRARYETPVGKHEKGIGGWLEEKDCLMQNRVRPRPTRYFDTDITTSIRRMKERERIHHRLPQKDCGCCGAPTCLAFAEDVARQEADLTDCIYLRHAARHGERPGPTP